MKYLVLSICLLLFLAVIFLDQNSNPVPMKVIVGNPHGVRLSMVILVSMLIGALLATVGMLLIRLLQTKNKDDQQH
ncbi:MAG TPA: DUF1049 domain-containing protein [Desulfuromonadales bacterium]|nr:DUF1049 domain-containing protein [Desulfuromonadales bacterium]